MTAKNKTYSRSGFTFVELMVSVVASTVLMLGLNAALLVALKSSDTSLTPVRATNEGLARLTEICTELQFATSVTEKTATAVTFTVPDRDANGVAETIRYAWSGTAGAALTRSYNGATATTVASDVHSLNFTYLLAGSFTRYISIRIQVGSDAQATVETGVALPNRP